MVCPRCNNNFEPKNSQQKYCSRKCANLAHQKRVRESRRSGSNPRFIKTCKYCTEIFYAIETDSIFCSNKCAHQARRKYLSIPDCLENPERKIDKNIGYVRIYCPMHREANTRGYVYEHRIIAETLIGRELLPNEVVHHKNGIRWDNRPENLEVMDKIKHSQLKK